MFSAYPDGWPGLGLLLLRAAAGSVLAEQGIAFYQSDQSHGFLVLAMVVTTICTGVLLSVGLLTRFAAAVAALGIGVSLVSWFPLPQVALFDGRSTPVMALMIAAALALIGPGAFSVDARLFGRREVIIPQNPKDRGA